MSFVVKAQYLLNPRSNVYKVFIMTELNRLREVGYNHKPLVLATLSEAKRALVMCRFSLDNPDKYTFEIVNEEEYYG